MDSGEGRVWNIIEYGTDEENAKEELIKSHSYINPDEIIKVEPVKEDHVRHCLIGVFSHAKRTLLQRYRRDRYRTYELDKTVMRAIFVILFLSWLFECDAGISFLL